MKETICMTIILLLYLPLQAGDRNIRVNIYNDGFSQISEVRSVQLEKGISTVILDEIAKEIDPASINLAGKNIEIRTIDYQFDIESGDRLYEKYLGQVLEFSKDDSAGRGKLLNFDEDYLYMSRPEIGPGIFIYERDDFDNIKLPQLSDELVVEPRISALVNSSVSGKTEINLGYLTNGIGWHAEYNLAYDGDKSADLTAWVSLTNESGVDFPNADVVLIAGQVEKEKASEGTGEQMDKGEAYRPRKSRLEPLIDYHQYKLPFQVTIGRLETKQALMIEPITIEVSHFFKYEWSETKSVVKSLLSFNNDKDHGPDLPMPAGRINIFDKKSGAFLGAGEFEGTPAGEKAEIYLGTAFDIIAERNRIDHKKIGRNKNADTIEIKIRNHKDARIRIIVAEEIYGYWEITQSSDEYTRKDFQNIEFEVFVESGREKIITYSVEYSY